MNDLEARQLIATIIASLARLQHRLFAAEIRTRFDKHIPGVVNPLGLVSVLQPMPSWLEGSKSQRTLTNATDDLAQTMVYLTAALAAPEPVDLDLACRAIQNISGHLNEWTPAARRFAEKAGIALHELPAHHFNSAALTCAPLPGTGGYVYRYPAEG